MMVNFQDFNVSPADEIKTQQESLIEFWSMTWLTDSFLFQMIIMKEKGLLKAMQHLGHISLHVGKLNNIVIHKLIKHL